MRALLSVSLLVLTALPAFAAERWETLPPTPAPIATDRRGKAQVNGISIPYRIYGQGSPVNFLHGGLANSDYWGAQVLAVAAHHTVILMDSRGHGRSTRDARAYGCDLMADDVVALMDHLKIVKADIVGWRESLVVSIRWKPACATCAHWQVKENLEITSASSSELKAQMRPLRPHEVLDRG